MPIEFLLFQVQEINLPVTIPCLGLAFIIKKPGRVFASPVLVSLKYLVTTGVPKKWRVSQGTTPWATKTVVMAKVVGLRIRFSSSEKRAAA